MGYAQRANERDRQMIRRLEFSEANAKLFTLLWAVFQLAGNAQPVEKRGKSAALVVRAERGIKRKMRAISVDGPRTPNERAQIQEVARLQKIKFEEADAGIPRDRALAGPFPVHLDITQEEYERVESYLEGFQSWKTTDCEDSADLFDLLSAADKIADESDSA